MLFGGQIKVVEARTDDNKIIFSIVNNTRSNTYQINIHQEFETRVLARSLTKLEAWKSFKRYCKKQSITHMEVK